MKKALSVLLTMGLTVSMLAGCGSNGAADNASAGNAADNSVADNTVAATESSAAAGEAKSASDIKVGVIYIGDENEGYTAAHMAGIDQMMSNLGLSEDQVVEKTLIPEDESAYDAAVDLADRDVTLFSVQALDMRATCSGSSRVPGGSVLPCNRISGSIFRTFQYAQLFLILSTKHVMFPALLRV